MSTELDEAVDLVEKIDLSESRGKLYHDKEAMVLKNVKFLGPSSANGRDYSGRAMSSYARLSEGENIYLDHSDKGGRSIKEFAGNGRNKRVEADGVYGDWHYTSNVRQTVTDIVERGLTGVGMSLSGSGRQSKQPNGRKLVEDYVLHRSTDFVANPATVKSLSEQKSDADNGQEPVKEEKKENTLDENKVNEALAALTKQVGELSEQVEAANKRAELAEKQAKKLKDVQDAISESGKTVPAAVRKALELMETKEDMVGLLSAFTGVKENKPAPTGAADPIAEGEDVEKKLDEQIDAVFETASGGDIAPGNVVLGVRK